MKLTKVFFPGPDICYRKIIDKKPGMEAVFFVNPKIRIRDKEEHLKWLYNTI